MSSGWNTARRAAASARMHAHKPWLKSTGPRTVQGKARARMNALKHGYRSVRVINERRQIVHYLRQQRLFLQQVRFLLRIQRQIKNTQKQTNELIATWCDTWSKNAGNPREFLLNMANCCVIPANAGIQCHPLRDPGLRRDDREFK